MGSTMPDDDAPYRQRYYAFFDDERRVSDILRNRYPTSAASNSFANADKAKAGNHDPPTPANRKSTFSQRVHPDPIYGRLDFGGSPFRDPISEISRLNLASDFDSDLHSYRALTVHNGPLEVFSRPIFIHDGASRNKAPADFGFSTTHDPTTRPDRHRNRGFSTGVFKSPEITKIENQNGPFVGSYNLEKGFRPIVTPYAFEAEIPGAEFRDTSETWNPALLAAFRSFGTRIRRPSKCEYRFIADLPSSIREMETNARFQRVVRETSETEISGELSLQPLRVRCTCEAQPRFSSAAIIRLRVRAAFRELIIALT
jgi:hypothetical protein